LCAMLICKNAERKCGVARQPTQKTSKKILIDLTKNNSNTQ